MDLFSLCIHVDCPRGNMLRNQKRIECTPSHKGLISKPVFNFKTVENQMQKCENILM